MVYWHGPYRIGTKYHKNADHKKKDDQPNPWRIYKRFNCRRGRYRCGFCVQVESKKPYKKASNQKHHSWERKEMFRENWDNIPSGKVNPKLFFRDPWDWS